MFDIKGDEGGRNKIDCGIKSDTPLHLYLVGV